MTSPGDELPRSDGRRSPSHPGTTFSFHGLYRVRVAHRGLIGLMRRELAEFVSQESEPPDLTIAEGPVDRPANSLPDHYSYDDSTFVFEMESGRIEIRSGHILAEPSVDPVELLGAWVENLMKPAIVGRGACFIHASAVSRDGSACLFPAWMGTGKTLVALHALAQGYDYMADDWCFVSESGDALGYPRWPSLKHGHFRSYPILRDVVAGGQGRSKLRRQIHVADFAETLRPSGYLARRFQRFLFDRFAVSVQEGPTRIFPKAHSVLRSPIGRTALLVSANRPGVRVRRISTQEAARRIPLAGRYERTPHDAHWLAVAYAGRGVPLADTLKEEAALLARALGAARCYEVVLPENPSLRDLDQVLAEIS